MSQLALNIPLNAESTLGDFCWNNNALLKHLLFRAFESQEACRIFYIWGNSGAGKSHLLQGCCQRFCIGSAIYLPLALLQEWEPAILEGMETQQLICVDDIDFIAQKKGWEEALFHLYNRVKENEKGILLITGNAPPGQLTLGLRDLKSRLGGSLVMQLNELNDADKIASLQTQAIKRGFEIPTPVGHFLINRCSRKMQDLQQLLDKLDKDSLAAQRKITIPFVKKTLGI